MPRLIDADALIDRHCSDCELQRQEACKADPLCSLLMWLDESPTIEAEPVKHGRWVFKDVDYVCSRCHEDAPIGAVTGVQQKTPFCPNCGAKMDLEEK